MASFTPLFANTDFSTSGRTVMYVLVTIAFLGACFLIVRRIWENELVVLGLATAAAAIGYSFVSFNGVGGASGGGGNVNVGVSLGSGSIADVLMKIAVVLVLGGVVQKLLAGARPSESASVTPKS